jgi:hypothetical protein
MINPSMNEKSFNFLLDVSNKLGATNKIYVMNLCSKSTPTEWLLEIIIKYFFVNF